MPVTGKRALPLFAIRSYDEFMSFSETVFLFVLALVVFGPKKLPEIARYVGKLLAELRRASNEFKSQIETEITHLETQKHEVQKQDERKKQEVFGPGAAPAGAVASMSLNPASSEVGPHDSRASLAAPAEATLAGSGAAMTKLAEANVIAENAQIPEAAPSSSAAESEAVPAAQESHG
jgi:sec-independent protein translocase protein TatB